MDRLFYLIDGYWRQLGDQRIHSRYPLMSGGPLPVILLLIGYLYFVRILGPKMMKSRQPYDILWTIRLYNITMASVSFYLFYRGTILTKFGSSYFGCKPVDQSSSEHVELLSLGPIYFITKIAQLLDTIFFVLRKKYNQASNMHVFHHTFIIICVWFYIKVEPMGGSVLFPYLHVGVHTILYSYYFLATFKSIQSYISKWKRHLTELEMVQFILSMVHFSFQGLSDCDYPPVLAMAGLSFNFLFLLLFCNYYYNCYIKDKPTKSPRNEKDDQPTDINRGDQLTTQLLLSARGQRDLGTTSLPKRRQVSCE